MTTTVLVNAGPWLSVPPPGYGGIENVLAALVPELRRRGVRVVLATVGSSTLPVDEQISTFPDGRFADLQRPHNQVMGIAAAHLHHVVRELRRRDDIVLVHDHQEALRAHGALGARPGLPPGAAHAALGPAQASRAVRQPRGRRFALGERGVVLPAHHGAPGAAPAQRRARAPRRRRSRSAPTAPGGAQGRAPGRRRPGDALQGAGGGGPDRPREGRGPRPGRPGRAAPRPRRPRRREGARGQPGRPVLARGGRAAGRRPAGALGGDGGRARARRAGGVGAGVAATDRLGGAGRHRGRRVARAGHPGRGLPARLPARARRARPHRAARRSG